jgi:GNAT acetyltransferase-like protein
MASPLGASFGNCGLALGANWPERDPRRECQQTPILAPGALLALWGTAATSPLGRCRPFAKELAMPPLEATGRRYPFYVRRIGIRETLRALARSHPDQTLRLLGLVLRMRGYRLMQVDPALPAHAALAQSFYRLRDQIFAQKYEWEEPRGLERDRYDRAAKFIVVVRNDEVVAGCRIIHRNLLNDALPMEETLDEKARAMIHPDSAVEISRMINDSGSRLVFDALHLMVRDYLRSGGLQAFASTRRDYLEKKLDRQFGAEHFPRLPGPIKQREGKDGKVYEFVPHLIII